MKNRVSNLMMLGYGLVFGFGVFGFATSKSEFQAGMALGAIITVFTMHLYVYVTMET